MFNKLIQFEIRYQFKQRAFLFLSLLFLIIGIQIGRQGYGRGTSIYNSPQSITEITGILTLGAVFIIMFFVISGVLKDSRYNMQPIIFSTPVKKQYYFWSQFLGVFMASVLSFSSFLLGFFITTLFPNLDPELVNAFHIADYLWTLLIIVLPNIFICTAIIFSVSILTKSNVATYASAILIYALYFLCSLFLNSPIMASSTQMSADSYVMAALLDPFGLSALFEQTQFWTVFEKNSKYIAFAGNFMWNRLLWVLVGVITLLVTYRLFSFRTIQKKTKKKISLDNGLINTVPYHKAAVNTTYKSQISAFISLFKIEMTNSMKSLPFIGVVLLWITIVIIEVFSRIVEGGPYNDSLYPAMYKLIELFVDPLLFLSYILIIFYSGEIVWRERSLHFNGIIDSSPTRNLPFFLSKFLAILGLPMVLIVMGALIAMLLQGVFGYDHFEIDLYLSLFYNPGLTFVFYALLALVIQSLIPNKYLGMGITGLIIVFLGTSLSSSIGLQHPMLLLGKLPNINFSGMNGFSGIVKGYNYLAVYWLLFASLLAFLSFKLWKRGVSTSLKFRFKLMVSNWGKKSTMVLTSLLLLFGTSAATVYYNTNVETDYITTQEHLDLREDYERLFKKYEDLRGLFPIKMETEVDLYPSDSRYVVRATYVLKNKSSKTLKQYLITEKEPLQSISLAGGELVEHNKDLGTYLFDFKTPIRPNDDLLFTYIVDKQLKGFETSKNIVKNGTYIQHRDFEPALGYRTALEISNPLERKERGLPEREEETISEDHIVTTQSSIGRVYYKTVVSTEHNQIALGSGELIKKWRDTNRNYYEYASEALIMPTMGYFSANYDVHSTTHKGIKIEQYFMPESAYNNNRIEESTINTLNYCTENFGPYPFKHIRIAQIPSHWSFGGFAHPGTISMTEDMLHLVDLRDSTDFDLVAKRTIHEVAHQWFGHILGPKPVEGGSMFVEGFAKYSEAVVMENMYGKSAIWELSRNANKKYFTWRTYDTQVEPPIYQVSGQGFLSYGKNYTVMLALRELIGEDVVNKVIKNLTEKYRDQVQLEVTSVAFLNEIYKVAPQEYHDLIDDWFKRVITYDLKIETASVTKKQSSNQFEVVIDVSSERFETNKDGSETKIDINEPIKIGLFSKHPKEYGLNEKPIYTSNYIFNKDTSQIIITVNQEPVYVAIDAYGTRSDENYTDNIFRIE
ncbi:ABC transporter permease/M1 family aminopeptidase [Hanstruepera ponticola]|uniref:ABC transporter permease/M1 family aminopeptidase n=1 Tax=Hanstruepera ponticola TaxID=2042995 RepID=UPI001781C367|nr:M1 family aminopeptidase [Hanstruepera ponticola]